MSIFNKEHLTIEELGSEIRRIDYLRADAVNCFYKMSDSMFITVTHALEVYREELVKEIATREEA